MQHLKVHGNIPTRPSIEDESSVLFLSLPCMIKLITGGWGRAVWCHRSHCGRKLVWEILT